MKLNLGSGEYRLEGWVNIDIRELPEVDLVYDLNRGIPFGNNIIDEIVASHVLEHIENPHFLMNEMLRVCRPNAVVEIRVPLDQIWQKEHLTYFYEDWFDRNCTRDWQIISKEIGDSTNIKGDTYQELAVKLKARP